jgi:hypothetical protein
MARGGERHREAMSALGDATITGNYSELCGVVRGREEV